MAGDDTLLDILQELGTPDVASKHSTPPPFTKTRPVKKALSSDKLKAFNTDKNVEGNSGLCQDKLEEWTDIDEDYFSQLGISTSENMLDGNVHVSECRKRPASDFVIKPRPVSIPAMKKRQSLSNNRHIADSDSKIESRQAEEMLIDEFPTQTSTDQSAASEHISFVER